MPLRISAPSIGGSGAGVAPTPLAALDFMLSLTPVDTLISGSSSGISNVKDLRLESFTSATVDHGQQLVISPVNGNSFNFSASLIGPAAQMDSSNKITRISDGSFYVLVATKGLTRRIDGTVDRDVGVVASNAIGFVEGSLIKHLSDAIDTRANGVTPSESMPIYSTIQDSDSIYVRNTASWVHDINLSCTSAWNSSNGNLFNPTLITPSHVTVAAHIAKPNGTTLRFVTQGNSIVERTITDARIISGTDIAVHKLSSDIDPSVVSFARILPESVFSNLPNLPNGSNNPPSIYKLAGFASDQFRRARAIEITALSNSLVLITTTGLSSSPRNALASPTISGDSGSPIFVIINNNPVLIGTWTTAISCHPLTGHISAINSALTDMGGGYQLTAADLSGFPTY